MTRPSGQMTALVAIAVALPTSLVLAASPSLAAGTPASVAFGYTGTEQSFTVPEGVTSVTVVAVGGSGAPHNNNGDPVSGGRGGIARGTIAVSPGEVLYVEVGGTGVQSGFNGGASGGGGASDVRTTARTAPNSTASRLVVAGGGGSASTGNFLNSAGGDAGQPGTGQSGCTAGGPGTAVGPGAGGTPGGTAGVGAQGGDGPGGGGGGWFGGGSGAYEEINFMDYGCGAGGGSNGFAARVTATSNGVAATTDVATSVTLSYVTPVALDTLTAKPKGKSVQLVAEVGIANSTLHATLLLRQGKKDKVLGELSEQAVAGSNKVVVKLNRAGKKALRDAKHKLRLTLVVVVTTPGGVSTESSTKVTLKKKKKH